jgi:hypothetical protein
VDSEQNLTQNSMYPYYDYYSSALMFSILFSLQNVLIMNHWTDTEAYWRGFKNTKEGIT